MLSFRYHSTNCFFLKSSPNDRLVAVDAGWPGTLYEYAREMKKIGCHLEDVGWAMATHFHMDHAGLVGELLSRGVTCVVFENQMTAIDAMEKTIEKNTPVYVRIARERLRPLETRESRSFFGELGIDGEVVITDYHSPDSVSLVLDSGEAVVGDLPPADQGMPDDVRLQRVWDILRSKGVRRVYPGHAGAFDLGEKGGI